MATDESQPTIRDVMKAVTKNEKSNPPIIPVMPLEKGSIVSQLAKKTRDSEPLIDPKLPPVQPVSTELREKSKTITAEKIIEIAAQGGYVIDEDQAQNIIAQRMGYTDRVYSRQEILDMVKVELDEAERRLVSDFKMNQE